MNRPIMLIVGVWLSALVCVQAASAQDDPWEPINKKVYGFNEGADKLVLKPIEKTYTKVVPQFARNNIRNVFSNLSDVSIATNNLLQGKPLRSFSDLGRIIVNSTLGLAGLFDPASGLGLVKHNESFGQTLTVWGVPKGPYIVLPLLGPSTLTDAIARPFDSALDPVRYLYPVDHRNTTFAARVIDGRAGLLAAESVVFGDRYIFLRDAYLQRRNYLVNDGNVEDDFDDF